MREDVRIRWEDLLLAGDIFSITPSSARESEKHFDKQEGHERMTLTTFPLSPSTVSASPTDSPPGARRGDGPFYTLITIDEDDPTERLQMRLRVLETLCGLECDVEVEQAAALLQRTARARSRAARSRRQRVSRHRWVALTRAAVRRRIEVRRWSERLALDAAGPRRARSSRRRGAATPRASAPTCACSAASPRRAGAPRTSSSPSCSCSGITGQQKMRWKIASSHVPSKCPTNWPRSVLHLRRGGTRRFSSSVRMPAGRLRQAAANDARVV